MNTRAYLKLNRKQKLFSVLKTIAYFAGYPLFLLFVVAGSVQFMHFEAFEKTWFIGIGIALIPWLLTAILQIVFARFCTSQNIKTIVVTVFVAVCMLGTGGILDLYGSKTVEKLDEQYAESSVEIPTYKYLVGHYVSTTKDYPSTLDDYRKRLEYFCLIYNVDQEGEIKNSRNTDGTPYTVGEDGIPYNPNGLVSECYIYSADFALTQLITYYELEAKMAALGKDIEAEYNTLLPQVEASQEYIQYQQTKEYQDAYGAGGSAYDHMLTVDRLDELIPVVAKYLKFILEHNGTIGPLLELVGVDLAPLDSITSTQDLIDYVQNDLLPLVSGMLDAETQATINNFLDVDTINALLYDINYYYSPTVRPSFDFFGEAKASGELIGEYRDGEGNVVFSAEEMHQFALARFYAKIQGAFIGSVLIPNQDTGIGAMTNANGNIGMVTMNDSGFPAEKGISLEEMRQLKADNQYIPHLYPVLAARRFVYTFAGLVALMTILFYQFIRREEDTIKEMRELTQEGGAE
ncbi:MAG: hypothetical protein J5755_05210 [Clostridia bacterium]|nr:hypothetical protein [Clostridia bacterium]